MPTISTSLSTFKNKFSSVRPSLFRVLFSIIQDNKFLKNDFIKTDKIKDMYIYCKNTSLPGSSFQESVVYYYGRPYSEVADRIYDPLDITFYNSQDFAIRNFIELWMNNINSSKGNKQLEADGKYNYFSDIQIDQLDRRNNIIKSYFFYDCYPLMCSPIVLDYTAVNTIEEFTVSFRYQWFQTLEMNENLPVPTTFA